MRSGVTRIIVQLVVKSQILAGGRGLGTFKSGLKGGVHIVKTDQVEDIAGNALSLCYFSTSKFPYSRFMSMSFYKRCLSIHKYYIIQFEFRDFRGYNT